MGPVGIQSGENTRGAILEASFKLFARQGFHATSMRDIAAEAGITAGSIYNHYSDKEEIIKAVILAYHPVIRVAPRLEQVEGDTAEQLIREAALMIAQEIEQTPGITNVFLSEITEMGGVHLSVLINEVMPSIKIFIAKVFSRGAKFRSRDPMIFFRAFLAMMIGYAVAFHVTRSLPQANHVVQPFDEYIEVFLHGILQD